MPKGVYDRSNVKKTEKTATKVPVKVEVKADPLNLQVTIDPASLEKATAMIEARCKELATHFEIPADQVNPFESLFLIADTNKAILDEMKGIHETLKIIQGHLTPTYTSSITVPAFDYTEGTSGK